MSPLEAALAMEGPWEWAAKLLGALLLALPVAWERERRTRLMGLRTFPLVSVASCAYLLILLEVSAGDVQAQARVVQGLLTGMGFIGGGAIVKKQDGVLGTATAAGLWATGAIGVAVAYELWTIALLVSLIIFLALHFLTPVERTMGGPDARLEREEEREG